MFYRAYGRDHLALSLFSKYRQSGRCKRAPSPTGPAGSSPRLWPCLPDAGPDHLPSLLRPFHGGAERAILPLPHGLLVTYVISKNRKSDDREPSFSSCCSHPTSGYLERSVSPLQLQPPRQLWSPRTSRSLMWKRHLSVTPPELMTVVTGERSSSSLEECSQPPLHSSPSSPEKAGRHPGNTSSQLHQAWGTQVQQELFLPFIMDLVRVYGWDLPAFTLFSKYRQKSYVEVQEETEVHPLDIRSSKRWQWAELAPSWQVVVVSVHGGAEVAISPLIDSSLPTYVFFKNRK
jgi:hypothetical protein